MSKRVPTKLPKGVIQSYAVRPPNLLAGRVSLDFVNTVSYRGALPHERGDRLVSYSELVLWARSAGTITQRHADALLRQADRNPYPAATVLQEAILIREAIAKLAITPSECTSSDLEFFNSKLAALPPLKLTAGRDGGFSPDGAVHSSDLRSVFWPVLRDAADLLVSDCLPLVRTCAERACSWVFLDLSQSRNRKWCSMKSCGNREKASRHYRRTKS